MIDRDVEHILKNLCLEFICMEKRTVQGSEAIAIFCNI